MTNTKEQKRQLKRKGSEKRQTVSFDAEEEAASKATEEYDQDEVDKVLGDQKFPTQKISSKFINKVFLHRKLILMCVVLYTIWR